MSGGSRRAPLPAPSLPRLRSPRALGTGGRREADGPKEHPVRETRSAGRQSGTRANRHERERRDRGGSRDGDRPARRAFRERWRRRRDARRTPNAGLTSHRVAERPWPLHASSSHGLLVMLRVGWSRPEVAAAPPRQRAPTCDGSVRAVGRGARSLHESAAEFVIPGAPRSSTSMPQTIISATLRVSGDDFASLPGRSTSSLPGRSTY